MAAATSNYHTSNTKHQAYIFKKGQKAGVMYQINKQWEISLQNKTKP